MFAIEEGLQKINGEMVETFQREVVCGNTNLEVEAGTTGYKGGCCRNAGGRTYLSLLCLSGDFFFGPIKDDEGRIAGITIACCGDDGLNAIMKALAFSQQAIDIIPQISAAGLRNHVADRTLAEYDILSQVSRRCSKERK